MVFFTALTAFPTSARQGSDFKAYSSILRFPANVNTINETIDLIIDDTTLEDPETFQLRITDTDSELNTTGSVITVTILDNDGNLHSHLLQFLVTRDLFTLQTDKGSIKYT